jgi:hypothetical protein
MRFSGGGKSDAKKFTGLFFSRLASLRETAFRLSGGCTPA